MNNEIYLRRRSKVVAPLSDGTTSLNVVVTMVKNLEPLGYTFSNNLVEHCQTLSLETLVKFYQDLVPVLKKAKGAHRAHRPMYPNFPTEVMEMSEAELYFNAIIHYITDGMLLPAKEKKERFPLIGNYKLDVIDLGSAREFEDLFTKIVSSNTSLSDQDKTDITWYVDHYKDDIAPLIPYQIKQKENGAYLAAALIKSGVNDAESFILRFCKTATDILRVAVALSDGDVSLAEPTKFRNFTRAVRRLFMTLLSRLELDPLEDMLRWKENWKRLGHQLHAGEYKKTHPDIVEDFDVLRNDKPFVSFNGAIEKAIQDKNLDGILTAMMTRPGDFARRLDHFLRIDNNLHEDILLRFGTVAKNVSTPVLLQVRNHFAHRNDKRDLRVFFPKGSLAKAQAVENKLPKLNRETCDRLMNICDGAMLERFAQLPSLGKVYLDESLRQYNIPFSQRSASKSLRTIVRGSRLPLGESDIIRFFLWWKDGTSRTDIDLSAVLLDSKYSQVGVLSYYNLRGYGGAHSGDIVSAPHGASEYIDISIEQTKRERGRFVVMMVNSYSQQPFCDLPECFAGWMERHEAASGEVYEPRTVQNRFDLTADTQIAIPLVIDLVERQVIWMDMGLKRHPAFQNNVASNLSGIALTVKALVEMSKPNIYHLLSLHASARATQIVNSPDKADTVFSVENGTPFQLEEIASSYL